MKTRVAYKIDPKTGKETKLFDTIQKALDANMLVKDWERMYISANPESKIEIRVENIRRK
jgi:hypothetical protein